MAALRIYFGGNDVTLREITRKIMWNSDNFPKKHLLFTMKKSLLRMRLTDKLPPFMTFLDDSYSTFKAQSPLENTVQFAI